MKVLVTGANGLLGHHVVSELLKKNHSVRIIVRSTKDIYFDLNQVEVCRGNFMDINFLQSVTEGCEAVIHVAAVTATDLLDVKDYNEINVEGTLRVLNAAENNNIKRFVFVSTANTIGFGNEKQLADENSPIEYPFSKSFYAQSKLEAEKLFLSRSKSTDKHYLIIHPTFMVGSMDPKPSSGKMVLMGYKKWILLIPRGGKNFVSVTDVAAAVVSAITKGKNGEKYLAAGINLSFKEFFGLQKQALGYKQCIIEIPSFVLKSIGVFGDLIRKLGIKTSICSMNLNQLLIREYYSNQKAISELNMPQSNLEESIKKSIEWFKKVGKIK